MTAYYLKAESIRAVVLEADRIGSGQTQNTTVKITSQHNLIYGRIIRTFAVGWWSTMPMQMRLPSMSGRRREGMDSAKKGWFYGWYFKCQSDTQTLAVIPAVHQTDPLIWGIFS